MSSGDNIPITSTGQDMIDLVWLDQYSQFSQTAYEAMVRWVGFQVGWLVLDAGCGVGSFLPLIANLVGPTGKLSALDLAPEKVAEVEVRLKARGLACPVEMRVGSVLSLPYPDHTFDAVWNANVSQSMTGDELRRMLAEFRRVVKPGGLVAVIDVHMPGVYMSIYPPLMGWHWLDAQCRSGNVQWLGRMRAGSLARWLREAGMKDVRRQFLGVDKSGPLNANDRALLMAFIAWDAEQALHLGLAPEDMEVWSQLANAKYVDEG